MDKTHIGGLKRQTENRFLNMYEIDAIGRNGKHFPYYMASRRKDGDLMCENGLLRADGVVVYGILPKNSPAEHPRIILVKQYRYPVGDYIYELPAGLVDEGETPIEAGIREMREETGYDFTPYPETATMWNRPFIQNQGMSDECDVTVFGTVSPIAGDRALEETEEISVIMADRDEVKRILREEKVTIRAAYLLMQFLYCEAEDPFRFLRET